MLGELRDLELAFHAASDERRRETVAPQYFEKLTEGFALEREFLMAAKSAFVADPTRNEDLKELLVQVSSLLTAAECYEDALFVSQMLLDNGVEETLVCQNMADSAFACSEFDLAEQYMRRVIDREGVAGQYVQRLPFLNVYRRE